MANNRLYITDDYGNSFMLAKSLGDGWYISHGSGSPKEYYERLEQFFDDCVDVGAFGIHEQTKLTLTTEYEESGKP